MLSDCVVYTSIGPSPLGFLPCRDGPPLPGGFKLGINPGQVRHESTQTILGGEEVRQRFDAPELSLVRYIKDGCHRGLLLAVVGVDDGRVRERPRQSEWVRANASCVAAASWATLVQAASPSRMRAAAWCPRPCSTCGSCWRWCAEDLPKSLDLGFDSAGWTFMHPSAGGPSYAGSSRVWSWSASQSRPAVACLTWSATCLREAGVRAER
ncbi:hypothetical protein GCM10010260_58520 [Streptomyces filipinensis]|uniref:Uncharacterized protein n=1 Tax=Streptomyces filipinensis TaxID=66887 RepID=A0A918IFU1_9ACTN|nr:hypothetical protein GCM10010260_58520 [Streptomyces filipinensis]